MAPRAFVPDLRIKDWSYMPMTAPNHALAKPTGPPVMTMALARLAKAHNPTTVPADAMEITALLEISAWVLTLLCTRVLVVVAVIIVPPGYIAGKLCFFFTGISYFISSVASSVPKQKT